ncbi:NDUFB7 isoform 2 [Pan troglodytes]|uniref:NDUFB7 isoform 2 n=1 Tax=Pan troglodytes TaxID=9598 RepID=A0A2J8LUP1_PANTR|nr:NDUFB7 isoform 2 [Pan troglodytes]
MGAHLVRRYLGDASVEPDPLQMPTFPPDYGFPERKERDGGHTAGDDGRTAEAPAAGLLRPLPHPAAQVQA